MFCSKCGNSIPDGAKFCSVCGQSVVNEPVAENVAETVNVTAEPVAETVIQPEASVVTETAVLENAAEPVEEVNWQFNGDEAPAVKKGSKKKLITILLFTALPLLLVVALVAMNFSFVAGYAVKVFGSDSDYLKYVESKAISSYADSITDYYDLFSKNAKKEKLHTSGEMKFVLGDSAKTILKQYAGDVDLSFINNTSFKFDTSVNKDFMSVAAAVALNGKNIASAECIMDVVNEEMFVAVKEFSDKYLKISLEDIMGANSLTQPNVDSYGDYEDSTPEVVAPSASSMISAELYKKLMEVLPEGDDLDDLVEKYIKIALEQVDDVKVKDKTVKIGGVSEKVEVYTLDIDGKLLVKMAEACLEEAKEDSDIEDIIKDVVAALEEDFDLDAEDVYEEFVDAIDDALDGLKDAKKQLSGAGDLLTLVDYVNSDHEVIGRSVEVSGKEVISYAKVTDGKDFAFEAVTEGFEITGKGTQKSDVINGSFEVVVQDKKVATVELIDLNFSEAKDMIMKGSIRVKPSADLLTSSMGEEASVITALNPAIEYKFDTTEKGGTVELNILSGDSVFIGLVVTATNSEDAPAIEAPSSSNVVDITDEEAFAQWQQSIDIQKLMDNLKNAGFPTDILDLIMGGGVESDADFSNEYEF